MTMTALEIQIQVTELMKIIVQQSSVSSSASNDAIVQQNFRETELWTRIQTTLDQIQTHEDKIAVLGALLQSTELTSWANTNRNSNKIPLLREFIVQIKLSQCFLKSDNENSAVLQQAIKQSLKEELINNLSTYSNLRARQAAKMVLLPSPCSPIFGLLALTLVSQTFWDKQSTSHLAFINALVEMLYEVLTVNTIDYCNFKPIENGTRYASWLQSIEYSYQENVVRIPVGLDDDSSNLSVAMPIWFGQCKQSIRNTILQQPADSQLIYYRRIIAKEQTPLQKFMAVERNDEFSMSVINYFTGGMTHYKASTEFGVSGVYKDIYRLIAVAEDECINSFLIASKDRISTEICALLRPVARQESPTNTARHYTLLPLPVKKNNQSNTFIIDDAISLDL